MLNISNVFISVFINNFYIHNIDISALEYGLCTKHNCGLFEEWLMVR
ncbi:hypothetical protein [Terrisporobacter glycolicus]|nr:hypothetical protein [Terrisporobacter glycolicus]